MASSSLSVVASPTPRFRCLLTTQFSTCFIANGRVKPKTLSIKSTGFHVSNPVFLLPISHSLRHSTTSFAGFNGLEQEEEEATSSLPEVRRLYVGNLPYSMTSTELTEVFGESGVVENAEVVYDRVTDRSRGFAFVTMGSAEEAKEAIKMFDGSQIGGRTVKVNFPEIPRGGEREVMAPKIRNSYRGFIDSPHKIYAGNLGWSLTSQALKDAFASQPGLLGAKVVYEKDTGRSRGYGFVSFASSEEAQSALESMNGVEVEGRPLRLNLAIGRAPTMSARSPEAGSLVGHEVHLVSTSDEDTQ